MEIKNVSTTRCKTGYAGRRICVGHVYVDAFAGHVYVDAWACVCRCLGVFRPVYVDAWGWPVLLLIMSSHHGSSMA